MAMTRAGFGRRLGRLRRISQRTPIGLDVGAATIAAVQLSVRPGRLGGEFADYEIAHSVTVERETKAGDPIAAELTENDIPALERLQRQARFAGRSVTIGLDTPLLDIQSLSLPIRQRGLGDPAIGAALEFELSRQLSYDLSSAEVRSWLLPPSIGSGPNVIGVVCQRDRLERTVRVASLAGLTCRRIELGCLALVRACVRPQYLDQQVIWGVLDVGHTTSRLTLAVGATPVLHREMDGGGAKFSSLIAQRLGVSESSAEQLKRQYGLSTGPGRPSTATGGGQGLDATEIGRLVFASLRRELARLAAEVERSFSYVIHLYPEAIVGQLFLAGGSANLKGLDRSLADHIGISVAPAEPPPPAGHARSPGSETAAAGAGLMQAVGLAILAAEAGEG